MPTAPCCAIPRALSPSPRAADRPRAGSAFFFIVIVVQDALGRAVEILELSRAQGPEEGRETDEAQQQRRRDEQQQAAHEALRSSARRSALQTTTSDELDMATAAISGVTRPATASGTVIVL